MVTMTTEQNLAQIGVVGLAVMGSNLARNFASRGHKVAVYNRSFGKTEKFMEDFGETGDFVSGETIEEFVASLEKPRRAIIMVQAGKATDAVIEQLSEAMDEGDIIIDGGNALFTDTIRREKEIASRNQHFVGAGISGGEEGALNGPSIMPGGPKESWEALGPLFESIAARAEDGTPCVTHVGPDGAGHFVKMVHNGIEYADMQVIGEAYQLLRYGAGLTPVEIAEIFEEWNKGDLNSFLIEITAEVLRQTVEDDKPLVDVILDAAGQKGTGRWTVKEALDLGVPTTGIGEAVFARALSSSLSQRTAAQGNLPTGSLKSFEDLGISQEEFIDQVRKALYASKLVAYAQGFDEIKAGSLENNWDINPGDMAMIWRAGCIIRAVFLEKVKDAYDTNPELESLLLDPYFNGELAGLMDSWRNVVIYSTQLGLGAPVFTSSLAYYDSLRAERLPAAIIQGQRDYFGAHTYQRVDKDGTFHIEWTGDRSETALD
ncbi:6-phosphogluconate dehydrogenase, NADP(+)-dependent, decarboxylating [Corynebacterium guangdongense]|nr:6-phosphogluconate dehydrogenase, NADP(+)-dependent, decarboxylating [Corynebacterium guangdongense]